MLMISLLLKGGSSCNKIRTLRVGRVERRDGKMKDARWNWPHQARGAPGPARSQPLGPLTGCAARRGPDGTQTAMPATARPRAVPRSEASVRRRRQTEAGLPAPLGRRHARAGGEARDRAELQRDLSARAGEEAHVLTANVAASIKGEKNTLA